MHTLIKLLPSNSYINRFLPAIFIAASLLFGNVSQSYAAVVELVALNEPKEPGIFPLFVFVDSEDVPTIGTDLMISYDPEKVIFQEAALQGMYPQEHEVQHDVEKNIIRFSGTNDFQSYTPVVGTMGILYFETLQEISDGESFLVGEDSPIKLIWSKEATNDTNVVSADGTDLVVAQPSTLRIDPDYSTGEVQGIFSDEQKALLAKNGIISQATQVQSKVSPLIVLGVILIFGGIIMLFFIFTKKKKTDDEADEEVLKN